MINRKIVLDTETTGLDYIIEDRIIEIAAIEVLNDKILGEVFHSYINPQININENSIRIHGITNNMIKDKPKFSEISEDLLNFIGDSLIIAHNAEFDRCFLNLELNIIKKETISRERFIDTLNLAKNLFKGEKYSLDDLCIKFNIDFSSRKEHHGALIDAKLLSKVYIEMINSINNNFVFEKEYNIKNLILKNILRQEEEKINYQKHNFIYRSFDLTQEEIKDHNLFINNNIKNPIWLNKK